MRLLARPLSLAIGCMLVLSPAAGGTFKVSLAPDDATAELSDFHLEGPSLGLADKGFGVFSFTAPENSESALLTVSGHPSDSAEFVMEINVPYYWSDTVTRQIVAAVTPPTIDKTRYYGIVHGGDQMLAVYHDLVLLNQETRLLFRQFLALNRPANEEEIKIISFFVITSKELALNNFVVPDDDMRRAARTLGLALAARPEVFENDEARKSARQAIDEFNQATHSQFNKIVSRLSEDVGEDGPTAELCGRARFLNDKLDDVASADTDFDVSHGLRLKNRTTLTICIAPDLSLGAKISPEQREESLAFAKKLARGIRDDSPVYLAYVGGEDGRVRNAAQGLNDIENLIAYYEGKADD